MNLTGEARYNEAVLTAVRRVVVRLESEEDIESTGSWGGFVLGHNERPRTGRVLEEEERRLLDVFYGFLEVKKSHDRLRAAEKYVTRYPYAGTSISRVDHLEYIVENYLQEFYIFKERLYAYLTRILRMYKNDKGVGRIRLQVEPLFGVMDDLFPEMMKARKQHVHLFRYTDDTFERLTALELLSDGHTEFGKGISVHFNREYRKARNIWKEAIAHRNARLQEILDYAYTKIYPLVFTRAKCIRRPRSA